MFRNGLWLGVPIVLFVSLSRAVCVRGLWVSNPLLEAPDKFFRSVPPSTFASMRSSRTRVDSCREARWRRSRNGPFFAQQPNTEGGDSNAPPPSPRVQFSGDFDFQTNNGGGDNGGGGDDSLSNPLDRLLTLVASDAFSIGAGILGLLAVVVYRWNLVLADSGRAAAEALTYQTRTDLLAVLASGSVLLNGVTKLDVTTALAESVVLEGTALPKPEPIGRSGESSGGTLTWALESILAATPAKTAILIADADDRWEIRCRSGVVPSSSSSSPASVSIPDKTPILERVGNPDNSKETYLPTLQALPGRTELTYLPNNTQMAVLIPIRPASSSSSGSGGSNRTKNTVLVLGGNTAKSFTPRDIAWSRIVAAKLGEDL